MDKGSGLGKGATHTGGSFRVSIVSGEREAKPGLSRGRTSRVATVSSWTQQESHAPTGTVADSLSEQGVHGQQLFSHSQLCDVNKAASTSLYTDANTSRGLATSRLLPKATQPVRREPVQETSFLIPRAVSVSHGLLPPQPTLTLKDNLMENDTHNSNPTKRRRGTAVGREGHHLSLF